MYALPKTNYLKRSLLVNDRGQVYAMKADPISHSQNVKEQLKRLGVSKYALLKAESRYLPYIIHKDEQLGGVVYGRHDGDFAILVATDRRVIFLDKKPLFVNEDEVNYFVVSGVTFNHSIVGSEVVLHTRIKDYVIHTFNEHCAKRFVQYIESRSLEYKDVREERSVDNEYAVRT